MAELSNPLHSLTLFSSPTDSLEDVLIRSVIAAGLAATGIAFASSPARAAKPVLTNGIVDVTTTLGLENGAAAGTGMVLTSNGEVLTNNHVIRGATDIRVIVPSTGKSYAATVIGYSVTRDVAVLQMKNASNLTTVSLGNSSAVKVGQKVTALGNAQGVGGKPIAAPGTITALKQTITASDESGVSEQLTGLIETNAALQPGDSGGPLVTSAGKVIGMDTAASTGFQFQAAHQGYAIPINQAVTLAKQIKAGVGSLVVHIGSTPFLGVSVATNQGQAGALVISVVPGSPADQAGIVAGDTLTALNGQTISTYDQLSSLLLQHHAGDAVTLTYLDETGATQSASLTTASGPPQ
jgi:S1-C subfamily serine protease